MASLPKHNITVEEYFALDDASSVKLEYYRGEVHAVTGALRPHNLIAGNAHASLHAQLEAGRCEVYQSDQRVETGDRLFTYSDISVACAPRFLESSGRTLLNPVLIVEVLSDSTEIYDRTNKFESYQTIESLQQYLLMSSNWMHVDLYTRDGTEWRLSSARRPEDALELASCGCRLQLSICIAKSSFLNGRNSSASRRSRTANRSRLFGSDGLCRLGRFCLAQQ